VFVNLFSLLSGHIVSGPQPVRRPLQKGKSRHIPFTFAMLRLSVLVATVAAASAFTAPASFLRTSSREYHALFYLLFNFQAGKLVLIKHG
jgi:hypothetical protein